MAIETQLVWDRKGFRRVMKYWNDGFIRGQTEEMTKLAKIWERGYNNIVSNWSNKPKFNARVDFKESTRRYFVRVRRRGDDKALDHFKWMDEGLRRSTRVNSEGETVANKVQIKGIKLPHQEVVELPRTTRRFQMGAGKRGESVQEYKAFLAEEKKKHTRIISPRGQALSKFGRDKRMPMREYEPYTKKGGFIGGAGKFNRPKVFRREVTLGDIPARNFTSGLRIIMRTGNDPHNVGGIWPGARSFRSWVRSGYRRGVRYAKAKQGTG